MSNATITNSVPDATARAFREANESERRTMEFFLGLQLREFIRRPPRTLEEIMNEVGGHAEDNGLTQEVLDEILRDEGDDEIRFELGLSRDGRTAGEPS